MNSKGVIAFSRNRGQDMEMVELAQAPGETIYGGTDHQRFVGEERVQVLHGREWARGLRDARDPKTPSATVHEVVSDRPQGLGEQGAGSQGAGSRALMGSTARGLRERLG